jgi:hypothetical protein
MRSEIDISPRAAWGIAIAVFGWAGWSLIRAYPWTGSLVGRIWAEILQPWIIS